MWNMGAMSFLRSAGASWPKTHIEALQIAHEGRRFAMKVLDQRITRCIKHGPSFPKGPSFSSIVKSNWMMNYPSSPWLGLQSIRNHPSVLTSLLGVLLAPILIAITRKWHDAPGELHQKIGIAGVANGHTVEGRMTQKQISEVSA